VKTYVRLADGSVKFHKDGYTDQRGQVRLRLGQHASERLANRQVSASWS